MSRSKKKPFIQSTHQIDKDKAHRAVRCKVHAELNKPEPDEDVLLADTRSMGLEEHGTVFGFEYVDDDSDDWEKEHAKKFARK